MKIRLICCALFMFLSTIITGCAQLLNLLPGNNSWDYKQAWADSNGKMVESPEFEKAIVECRYNQVMNEVGEMRRTYPRDVIYRTESLEARLDRHEDERKELEERARLYKPVADAQEIAVKECVRGKGVTAQFGFFNLKKGIFIPDKIQVQQLGAAK